MSEKRYTMGQLRKRINEAKQEFQAKFGDGVETGNKKNNSEGIKQMNKETSDYNGGLDLKQNPLEKIGSNGDFNKTPLDVDFDFEPTDEYKERVKAQVHGYPSKDNEEMHKSDDDTSFDGNKAFYDALQDRDKLVSKNKEDIKKSGLAAREMPKNTFEPKSVMKNESIKKLTFKNAQFLSESHMATYIPEKYKVDGSKFIMCDKLGNEYLIEWIDNGKNIKPSMNVISTFNKNKLNEDLNSIKRLMGYKHEDEKVSLTTEQKKSEIVNFKSFLDKVRSMSKQG